MRMFVKKYIFISVCSYLNFCLSEYKYLFFFFFFFFFVCKLCKLSIKMLKKKKISVMNSSYKTVVLNKLTYLQDNRSLAFISIRSFK